MNDFAPPDDEPCQPYKPRSLPRSLIRRVDQLAIDEYGIPGILLMENAGRGCADVIEALGIHGPVVICCGRGNNGADGFVIARHLEARGHDVQVIIACDPEQIRGDAAVQFEIARKANLRMASMPQPFQAEWLQDQIRQADWIVDAVLGTGAQGALRPPLDRTMRILNASSAKKFAVDLPSGLDADTGEPAPDTFRADYTGTFVARKKGFDRPTAQMYLGTVHVLEIGVPGELLRRIFQQAAGG